MLLGVPWDGGVTYQPGARFAPYEVRRVSALVQGFHPTHEVDVFRALRVVDGGNVALPPFDAPAARALVRAEVSNVVAAGAAPFVIGGDHSIALPVMQALAEAYGPLCVVHVDAHLDTSTGELWGDAYHHGTPFRHALADGLIAPGGLFQVGVRANWGHPEEGSFAAQHGATQYDMDRIADEGVVALATRIVEAVRGRPVYLSFDVDGVDPAFAPGTGTPVPGGLSSREAVRLLRSLAGVNLVGMDLVEICPALDHADLTVHLGAQLLFEGLALRAVHRGAEV